MAKSNFEPDRLVPFLDVNLMPGSFVHSETSIHDRLPQEAEFAQGRSVLSSFFACRLLDVAFKLLAFADGELCAAR